ncbi:MAG: SipW-dependent-type signal peptide-containing protein [bacterium]|nr:SipW-dependent-type signal peptide-containing protein [bacterium]
MTTILNKKILLSLGMIAFVAVAAIGATGAFFSDTETSTGNTFTAGDIDLQIDNESYVTDSGGVLVTSTSTSWAMTDLIAGTHKFFDFADLKPGDIGEDTISIHVGSNDAWMCAAARITSDLDNSITEPEDEVGGPSGQDGTADGDLDSAIDFVFWNDDGDNVLETDEVASIFLNGPLSGIGQQGTITLADSGSSILSTTTSPTPISGGTTFYIGKAWCFGDLTATGVEQDGLGKTGNNGPTSSRGPGVSCDGSSEGNITQTDSVQGDMQFYATQSRNNDEFSCSAYTPTWGQEPPTEPIVGALLSAYVAPTACNVTVTGTIQAAIDSAVSGNTVCVPAGTYNEDVAVNKDITLAGAGSGSTNIVGQTSGEAGAVVITADGATVQGFNITDATGGFAALRISGTRSGITVNSNTLNGVTGGAAFLTDGGQSNHTISNNVMNGVAGQPIAYVNGLASVNVASTNVDFTNNTFSGSGSLALGQEAGGSSITQNKFSAVTSFTDVEDWEGGNNYNQNNFNDAGLNLQHSENGNTGENGITNAENNWWGDANPADGDVNANVDVDFTPSEASAFAQN